MELSSLRKIRRICLWGCGPGPLASAHGSTDFIKRQPLPTRSTAQIKPSESVSRLLISAVHHRSDGWDGWLQTRAVWAHATMVGFWWGLLMRDHSDEGNVFMLTLIGGEWQRWGSSAGAWRQWGWPPVKLRLQGCVPRLPRAPFSTNQSRIDLS
jgi:hypothetical protein